MCAIIAWAGKLPRGLLSSLLSESEIRGKDSTGVAYRAAGSRKTVIQRQAIRPSSFVKNHPNIIGEARKCPIGIGHTRRASPRMPINDANAHPFAWDKLVFAHNGRIENWDAVKAEFAKSADPALAAYANRITTDSMVLGPGLKARDLTPVIGCMALVWMERDRVFCARSAKELSAATITWTEQDKGVVDTCTVVTSTMEILHAALAKVPKDAQIVSVAPHVVDEGFVYELTPAGLSLVEAIPTNPNNHADAFTSGGDNLTLTGDAKSAKKSGRALPVRIGA